MKGDHFSVWRDTRLILRGRGVTFSIFKDEISIFSMTWAIDVASQSNGP